MVLMHFDSRVRAGDSTPVRLPSSARGYHSLSNASGLTGSLIDVQMFALLAGMALLSPHSIPKERLGVGANLTAQVDSTSTGPSGEYSPTASGGSKYAWQINDHNTLIWDGLPYLPVGVRTSGAPEEVGAISAAGIQDVVCDVPVNGAGWKAPLATLQVAKMHYLLNISSLAPMAQGFAIEPQGYRVADISGPKSLLIKMPGSTRALVLLVNKRDASVQSVQRVAVQDGLLQVDVKPKGVLECVALIYPEMRSLQQIDFWEGMDKHRDSLLAALKNSNLGPGLRGILNPLGTTPVLPGKDCKFVPSSPTFQMELRDFLEEKYRSLETAQKAWSLSATGIDSFEGLARLVPLWSGMRGVSEMWDPVRDRFFVCDNRRSTVWSDLAEVMTVAATRRTMRLARSIRSCADVPVLFDWAGWSSLYEMANPAIDGLGMRASGTTPSAITDSASRATSSILRWKRNGWLAATDIDPGAQLSDPLAKSLIDDLASLGARTFFFRATSPEALKAIGQQSNHPKELVNLESNSVTPVFFPENATNPAQPQRLPAGKWWLPCPSDGERMDLGRQFSAYRLNLAGVPTMALWANTPGRYKLRMVSYSDRTVFETVDGSDPKPKKIKTGVEIDLTTLPILISGTDETPIPEIAFEETVADFGKAVALGARAGRDLTNETFYFQDAFKSYDRSPSGAFPILRSQLRKLEDKVGEASWLEAENAEKTNFGEVGTEPGCSAGKCLILKTAITPEAEGYYADFVVPVKSRNDQDVWVAARISPEQRGDVRMLIGGQVLRFPAEPLSPYGLGFAWYRLGVSRLAGNSVKFRIIADAPGGADLALDAIVFAPAKLRPNGIYMTNRNP